MMTENVSQGTKALIDWKGVYQRTEALPFDWIDGPTFIYQNNKRQVIGACQKSGDTRLSLGKRCPWKEESSMWWRIEADLFTAGASRPLADGQELKMGQSYMLIAGYMIEEDDKTLAESGGAIYEIILAESSAMVGYATACLALALSLSF